MSQTQSSSSDVLVGSRQVSRLKRLGEDMAIPDAQLCKPRHLADNYALLNHLTPRESLDLHLLLKIYEVFYSILNNKILHNIKYFPLHNYTKLSVST